ncbi:MAG TPA: amidohydrolase family protein [Acetobacteraceae bacterium]|nr:amidohydrolase family protein [Acetobacteraceae bacterium]
MSAPVDLIDCDVHPAPPGMAALLPHLDEHWREQVLIRGIDGLDLTAYPPTTPLAARPDWRPADGKPGSDLAAMQRHALDRFRARFAICNTVWGAQGTYNAYFAAALCRGINRWIAAEWLDKEPRLRASIVVPWQDAELAAEEIAHWAADRRFVQVQLLAAGDALLGKRQYWPIYAAAVKHGLPVSIHAGSAYRHATTSIGWPSYYVEDYAANAQAFQGQLLSLIYEGVFTRFPALTVVLAESGFTWLPPFMWRANKTWRGVRIEVPWVDRAPSDIIRDHVRFTLQPVDAPPEDPAKLTAILEQIGSDDALLFSTDYPHWQFDGEDPLPPELSPALARKIAIDNPLATYPRLKETVQ